MNVPELNKSALAHDYALLESIRTEVRALLSQRSDLADWQQAAAVKEKTLRLAHDIRNPLATIQAVCGNLLLETEDPEKRERLQLINSQVERLASFLSESVDAAASPDEPPISVNLEDLAASLVNLLQYQTDDDLVFRVQVEPGLYCRLPERGLCRSLYELLRNAADAVTGQGDAQVHLACRRENTHVEVEVADNGPGLPPQLVQRGLQVYAAATPAVGLCTVERFVGSLEGRLVLGKSASGGALVRMILPVDCLRPGQSQAPQAHG